jgi:CheY-like chemotaxis protein
LPSSEKSSSKCSAIISGDNLSQSVLVVDDEKSLRDFVRRNLEVRGYKVLTASNGLEALAISKNENIQLVIMDIMMPHMDGMTALRRIRQSWPETSVIMFTGKGSEEIAVEAAPFPGSTTAPAAGRSRPALSTSPVPG